jgi:hypothetical protein
MLLISFKTTLAYNREKKAPEVERKLSYCMYNPWTKVEDQPSILLPNI